MIRQTLVSALVALGVTACAANPTEGQLWGTEAGAMLGGGIGRAAAIGTHTPWAFSGVGVVAGMAMGYALGDQVDPPAQRMWAAATVAVAESGQPQAWESHGHRGLVIALGPNWTDGGGFACRALRQEASRLRPSQGLYTRDVVACRRGDGSWEVTEPVADSESQ